MASYKFWKTQPVPQFNSVSEVTEGPIQLIKSEDISSESEKLSPGYEWVTLDLNIEVHLDEVFRLLAEHYVEDNDNGFRFLYSKAFLKYAWQPPGWNKNWHLGIRSSDSKDLVACICGVPMTITVRQKSLQVSAIDYLCIHTSLRRQRFAPVLIKEITRRCCKDGVFQAVYTSGTVLPKPIATARYYHRTLNYLKLYETGFRGPLTKARVDGLALPEDPMLAGIRLMKPEDVPQVHELLCRYLKRFDLALSPTQEETQHWLMGSAGSYDEGVIYTYVIEDPGSLSITDFVSFYTIETSVLKNQKHKSLKVAYLNYYASESGFSRKQADLEERLIRLISDALILAKSIGVDVFNALTTYHNHIFLHKLKFGRGDGELHFYLFNYHTAIIQGSSSSTHQTKNISKGGIGIILT